MNKEKFKFKIFTSFILTVAFLVVVVSGTILFISPPGRVANWTSWAIMGFGKHDWSALHIVFVTIFLVAGIFHLFYFNWKLFWSYIKQKTGGGLNYKREFFWAIGLSVIFLVGTAFKIPPVINIVYLNEYVTNSWEKKEERPPVARAEQLTLKEYTEIIKQPYAKVISVLQEKGYETISKDQTLESLADNHGSSANEINILLKKEIGDISPSNNNTGSGYGKMEFKHLIKKLGLTYEEARQRLKIAGIIKLEDNQTLREIGMANATSGKEVLDILSRD